MDILTSSQQGHTPEDLSGKTDQMLPDSRLSMPAAKFLIHSPGSQGRVQSSPQGDIDEHNEDYELGKEGCGDETALSVSSVSRDMTRNIYRLSESSSSISRGSSTLKQTSQSLSHRAEELQNMVEKVGFRR